jgi:outer membrane immunogenic protein
VFIPWKGKKMKKVLTKLGVGSIIALGLAINPLTGVQAVFAADADSFEGFNAQVGIGYQSTSGKIDSITNGSNVNGASITQGNGSSVAGVIGLGYTKALSDSFTLGLEAEYNAAPASAGNGTMVDKTGAPVSPTAGTNKFTLNNQASISLVPGFAVSKDALIYAKVGYAMATLKTDANSNGTTFSNVNVNGILVGLGAKYNFSKNVYGFAEANAIQYGNASTNGTVTNPTQAISGTAKTNAYNGLVGVGYRF